MTLLQRSDALAQMIKDLVQLKEHAAQAAHFARRADDLAVPASELREWSAVHMVLTSHGIVAPGLGTLSLTSWAGTLSEIKDRYTHDPKVILDPFPGQDVRAIFVVPLKQLPARVREVLKTAWSEWVEKQMPAIRDDLLAVLSGIPALRSSVQTISDTKRRALQKGSELPRARADIDEVLSFARQIDQAWRSLTGDGIPDEVIAFIRIAGQPSGAPVGALTPLVLEWFEQHRIDQALRIRVI